MEMVSVGTWEDFEQYLVLSSARNGRGNDGESLNLRRKPYSMSPR